MTTEQVTETKLEAIKFVQRVIEWEQSRYTYSIGDDDHLCTRYGVKESGALRRSSVDLTRSLAKMREAS
jgi:hypothetical protein